MTDVRDHRDEPMLLRDAAARYKTTYGRLQKAAHDGRLLIDRRVGKQILVRPSAVEKFLHAKGRPPAYSALPVRQDTPMRKIVTVTALKGGTAKTTSVYNLGAAFAERGLRVLLIDMDPQANLTQLCGLFPAPEPTLVSAFMRWLGDRAKTLGDILVPTPLGPNAQLAPGHLLMSRVEIELLHAPRREYVLQELLADVTPRYDVVLIDTPPSVSNLVTNALVAADEVIIPTVPEPLSASGLQYSLEDVAKIRQTKLNPDLQIRGVLITRADTRTGQHRSAIPEIRDALRDEVPVFEAVIASATSIVEAQSRQIPVLQYNSRGVSAKSYRDVADEVINGWQSAT